MLLKIPHVKVLKKYTNPITMIEALKHIKVDVLFLEMEMKTTHGLTVSTEVRTNYPHIDIVFIATDSRFALQAFDANAMDFILEPVKRQRLQQAVLKIKKWRKWITQNTRPAVCTDKRQ